MDRLHAAYNTFMKRLGPLCTADEDGVYVKREDYRKVLNEVENEFNIKQGDEDHLEWVLTLIGRSPKIIEDGEEPS